MVVSSADHGPFPRRSERLSSISVKRRVLSNGVSMTDQPTDRWRRIKSLVADAAALGAEERARFLAAAISDEAMRQEVEALLAAHDEAGDVFERPRVAASAFARVGIGIPVATPHLMPGRRLGPYEIVETHRRWRNGRGLSRPRRAP